MQKFETALTFAMEAHSGQKRYDGRPYIVHPLTVALKVSKYQVNEDIIIAAMLHDTLEDTSVTARRIDEVFGQKVMEYVMELTNEKPYNSPGNSKKLYLAHKVVNMSNEALIIKLCDRLDNVTDMNMTQKPEFIEYYTDETKYVIGTLLRERKLENIHQILINEILQHLELSSLIV